MKSSPQASAMDKSQEPAIRVLVVDDHFVARIGLAMPVNQEPDMKVVAEAGTLREAQDLYREHLPDVVVMDYRLPDGDGPDAVKNIRQEYPGARILMLSAFDGEEPVYRAIEAGVCGYLTKNASCDEVLDAIRRIHAGQTVVPPALAAKAVQRGHRPELTTRELEIVLRLANGNSNKQIADQLHYSESLIKQELVKIFDKLGAHDRAHAATIAIERGLVQIGPRM